MKRLILTLTTALLGLAVLMPQIASAKCVSCSTCSTCPNNKKTTRMQRPTRMRKSNNPHNLSKQGAELIQAPTFPVTPQPEGILTPSGQLIIPGEGPRGFSNSLAKQGNPLRKQRPAGVGAELIQAPTFPVTPQPEGILTPSGQVIIPGEGPAGGF